MPITKNKNTNMIISIIFFTAIWVMIGHNTMIPEYIWTAEKIFYTGLAALVNCIPFIIGLKVK